jgi:exodeoxyribonuclease VII large subunit
LPYALLMPSITNDKKIFSLLEVTQSIQKTLSERYSSSFWVKAEMNKLNYYPHSGHCYPDLVEKRDGKVIAQLRSTLWKDDFFRINTSFLRVLKTPLKDGINMLFCAKVTFDPAHGLALRIIDIDPVFSLGELEREKQETIDKLKSEGIFTENKTLRLPPLPQRIAIISVQTSKGYADFLQVINTNAWEYKFFQFLFPSLLQGERAVESILYQLGRIKKVIAHFDVVAIIRGGGGDVGLSCFNNYELSREIARFPIPVITGIGHATNETVVETISYKNAITPTDLANYLLEKFHEFAGPVHEAERKVTEKACQIIDDERLKFRNAAKYFRSVTDNILIKSRHEIQNNSVALVRQGAYLLQRKKESHALLSYEIRRGTLTFCNQHKLDINRCATSITKDVSSVFKIRNNEVDNLERSVNNMRPENVLKRGFSITLINGKAVKSIQQIKPHVVVNTVLLDGIIESEVTSVKKEENT